MKFMKFKQVATADHVEEDLIVKHSLKNIFLCSQPQFIKNKNVEFQSLGAQFEKAHAPWVKSLTLCSANNPRSCNPLGTWKEHLCNISRSKAMSNF